MEDTKNFPKAVPMERKNLPRKHRGGYIDLPEGLDDIMRNNIRKTLVEIDEKFPGIDFIDLEYLYITAVQGELFWYKF